MCGIVGYIGNNAVAEELINGLKNLEYRGYDSAGIALNDNENIDIFKAKGKLCNLCDVLEQHKKQLLSFINPIFFQDKEFIFSSEKQVRASFYDILKKISNFAFRRTAIMWNETQEQNKRYYAEY